MIIYYNDINDLTVIRMAVFNIKIYENIKTLNKD